MYFILLKLFFLVMVLSNRVHTSDPLPHVVFIVADDLGWNDVSFHGSLQVPTPNIDAFARDGIILNNYYVAPSCSPSRGSLMTGKYPIRLGLQHLVISAACPAGLPLKEKILPQYLNDLGYVSHGIGKWHLGFFRDEYIPTRRGFKSFFGYWTGKEDYYSHFALDDDYIGLDLHDDDENVWKYDGQYATDVFTDKARTIIHNHNKSQPLFLYMSHQAVHSGNEYDPLQVPEKYVEKNSHIPDETRRKFAGIVSSLDDAVGKLAEALEETGMLDNTLLIFSTDNGGAVRGADDTAGSNWPLRGGKYTLWQGGTRGAAWMWSPELRKKSYVDNDLFHISDWLPTIYRAIGKDPKVLKKIDGVDQWSRINGKDNSSRNEVLLNIDQVWKNEAIIMWPYKLIYGSNNDGMFDGWFDKQGKFIRDFDEEEQFTYEEEEHHHAIYMRELESSTVTKILLRKYGKDVQETKMSRREGDRESSCFVTIPLRGNTACHVEESPCLFDIQKDPCELNDLSHSLPLVKSKLQRRLDKFRRESLPPKNFPLDPAADPVLHDNAWISWKSVRKAEK